MKQSPITVVMIDFIPDFTQLVPDGPVLWIKRNQNAIPKNLYGILLQAMGGQSHTPQTPRVGCMLEFSGRIVFPSVVLTTQRSRISITVWNDFGMTMETDVFEGLNFPTLIPYNKWNPGNNTTAIVSIPDNITLLTCPMPTTLVQVLLFHLE